MVQLRIPINKEGKEKPEIKTFSSRPLTFGLVKAFAQYGVKQTEIYKTAQALKDQELTGEEQEALNMVDSVEALAREMTEILIRAFGYQFTVDELDEADGLEVETVFAKLQLEAAMVGQGKKV